MPTTRRAVLQGATGAALAACSSAVSPAPAPSPTRFGINVHRLFLDAVKAGGQVDTAILETLGRMGIPFARFAASGHWAADWARFAADPAHHWRQMDRLFAAAEQAGVALVPSVLWNPVALAYHCGEAMQAWLDPASRTAQTARGYVEAFALRYDRSPALLVYEFANEMNDWVDLPNVLAFWPRRDPALPGRHPREADRLGSGQLRTMAARFAAHVRRHGTKPMTMGSNLPRGNAWHLARGAWDRDTPDQFVAQLRALTPPAMGVLSVHLYEDRFGGADDVFSTLPDLLTGAMEAARADGRGLFIGEFGVAGAGDRAGEERRFAAMVEAIAAAGVPHAAAWNYSPYRFQPEWDIAPGNARGWQLEALAAANRRATSAS